MKKSKRILKLFEMVPENSNVVFDVGCDHGILSALLVTTGKAKKVYASDISSKSLEKTKVLKENLGIGDKIECLVSNGLNDFDKTIESDCVVIAGMGGNEIIKILSSIEDFSAYKMFLLQPAQDFYEVRKFLSQNGFEIISDQIIQDKGKFYANILCVPNSQTEKLTNLQCYFGKFMERNINVDFIDFVNYTYTKLMARKDYLIEDDLERLEFCKKYKSKEGM